MIEIKSWITGETIITSQTETLAAALVEAVKAGANLARANLDGANLDGANLDGANLARANLDGANLARANLARANLDGANLDGANLARANLARANLARANLDGANLDGANLDGANLDGANLDGASLKAAKLHQSTRIDTGETWGDYLTTVLPELLRAGGRELAQVVAPEHWACHDWNNCPMAAAFNVKSEMETPILLRPRVKQFVTFFDAGLIPLDLACEMCGVPKWEPQP